MFEKVQDYPVDPIMIGADYFAQDPRTDKLNLTVGIYQDAQGRTPVLKAVKLAEQRLVEQQTTKSYLALTGDADYCAVLGQAIMGNSYGTDWVAAQTSGGAVSAAVRSGPWGACSRLAPATAVTSVAMTTMKPASGRRR